MDLKKTGRLIAKKIKVKGLSLGQLPKRLGVTPQAVHLWETGQRYPDASLQVVIHRELGLNPVELLTGLEMFDEELKRAINGYMSRIDEKVFVAGNMKDEDGNDVYVDLSDFLVLTANKDGDPGDRLIPYSDYYNVEAPKEKCTEKTKSPYDPQKVYLNHGHSILMISVEMLEELGKPSCFNLVRNRKNGDLLIVFTEFLLPQWQYEELWEDDWK